MSVRYYRLERPIEWHLPLILSCCCLSEGCQGVHDPIHLCRMPDEVCEMAGCPVCDICPACGEAESGEGNPAECPYCRRQGLEVGDE